MNIPTKEQVEKLPKWAQEYIKNLDRRVDVSERALKQYQDTQTKSPFFYDEILCVGVSTPQFSKRYIQTNNVSVINQGVRADILIRDDAIEITWADEQRSCGEVAMVPESFQKIRLKAISNLRK